MDTPLDNKKRREEKIKAELLAMEERDRQTREELRKATEAAERLSGGKIPESSEEPTEPEEADQEEDEIEEEIENLSPEDREKIGWGLSTIGFKVEKAKDDFFAGVFDQALKKIDKKGTTGRFCTEMRDNFVRDAKVAFKKAEGTTSGEEKHRLSNASFLFGNVLKYGRMVTDLTGKSLASPLRYVMMAGMATARMAEAGKEARLKNEDLREKIRIVKDLNEDSTADEKRKFKKEIKRAEEEAWKIYENARKKEGKGKEENVSTETLKNAYMMEVPKDLLKRLENPSIANTFIQGILREELLGHTVLGHVVFEGSISRLNKKIEKLEKDNKLTSEEKEKEIEKLIIKQKKNLEDYDRMITQYGTVDALAMAGRYAQTAGKATVAVLQVETLVLSAEKLFGTISQILTSHDFHPLDSAEKFVNDNILHREKTPTTPTETPAPTPSPSPSPTETPAPSPSPTPAPTPTPIPDATPAPIPKTLPTTESVKFEHGKGGIKGVLELLKQKDPSATEAQAIKEAMRFGLYDPNNPNESALIREGSTLKFDDHGNIIFHDAKTGEDVTHYTGKMFDSDGSGNVKIPTAEHLPESSTPETPNLEHHDTTTPTTTPESTEHPVEPTPPPTKSDIERLKELKEETIAKYPPEKTSAPTTGGIKYQTGSETPVGSEVRVGSGEPVYDVNGYHVLENHPEFLENPYNLSGEELMQVYETSQKDIGFLFENKMTMIEWERLGSLKAGEILKYTDNDPIVGRLSDYLNLLKNFTNLEPKSGFLGWGAESNKHYIARCLQALEAGKGKASLETFEENLRS